MKASPIQSGDEMWCCAECREVTTEAYDFEAGTMARYERHTVRCTRSPVAIFEPTCQRVVIKTHPAWNWSGTFTL